ERREAHEVAQSASTRRASSRLARLIRSAGPALLERQAEAPELFGSRDGRLEVEDLDDLRVLADQLARPRRQLLLGCLQRLPQVDGAPALRRLVREPALEQQPGEALERRHGLVTEVAAQLADARERGGEIPDLQAHA